MKRNIIILTRDEPFLVPTYLSQVVKAYHQRIAVVYMDASPSPHLGKKQLLRLCGPWRFAWQGARYVAYKLLGALGGQKSDGTYYSVRTLMRRHGIEVRDGVEPGSDAFYRQLAQAAPALVLSVANSKILPPRILGIPGLTFLNVHGSPLPRYRGILTAFWMLRHDEDTAGVTVHEMVEEVDAGRIVAQRTFPVEPDDTVMSLYARIAGQGAELLRETVDAFDNDAVPYRENPSQGPLYMVPAEEDMAAFLATGRRFA